MERVRRWETTAGRTAGRHRSGRRDRRNIALAPREKRRLLQLCVCAILFLVVFVGRDAVPGGMEEARKELLQIIQADTDFKAVFSDLGRAMDGQESGKEVVVQVWKSVLGTVEDGDPYIFTKRNNPLYVQERKWLTECAGTLHWPGEVEMPPSLAEEESAQSSQAEETPAAEEAEIQPEDPLGVGETVAPVMAPVSSGFGLREHPIEGGEKFHNGLDLAANYGTDIKAFASGVVDYIGESPAYGQYLQLQHANGVTSFYAHCSRLCVQPGQQIQAGDKVAEVGDTGEVTGAHLHFEVKVNGELVDPADYIQIG